MSKYATISIPADIKKRLEKAKGDKEWGAFLLELYIERCILKSKKAFEEIACPLTEEDLKLMTESSVEFREKFAPRMDLLDKGIVIEMLRSKRYKSGAITPLTLIEVLRGRRQEENKSQTAAGGEFLSRQHRQLHHRNVLRHIQQTQEGRRYFARCRVTHSRLRDDAQPKS